MKKKSNSKIKPKLQKALGLQRAGQLAQAAVLYGQVVEIDRKNVLAHYNLAIIAQQTGRIDLAISEAQQLLAIQPENIDGLALLGGLFLVKGDLFSAQDCFQKTLTLSTDHLVSCFNLAEIHRNQRSYDQAIKYYQQALTIKPDYGAAAFFLADLFEKTSRLAQANAQLEKAKGLGHSWKDCLVLEAKLLLRAGEARTALDKLSPLEISDDDTFDAACQVLFLRGKLYDRLGETENAFQNFARSNLQYSRSREASQVDARRYLAKVMDYRHKFSREWVDSWTVLPDNQTPDPAFIIGFPRSGTTLLDQILDSHPQIKVLEEKQIISRIVSTVAGFSHGYPDSLALLTEPQVKALRQEYYRLRQDYLSEDDTAGLVIDKLPLNIVDIGIVARLFPGARVIFVLRHPLDVCLSNFMQFFVLNDAMANFLTLEGTARLYAAVMDLWFHYVEVLEINYHYVKYENIVENLEHESRQILDFLEVGWDQKILEYHQHVTGTKKAIHTPSYQDVSSPIFFRARYRWRRYRDQLEPIIDILAPYLEKFGYEFQ